MPWHEQAKSKTDTWLTPRWILDRLGHFDLDPCAAIDQPWQTASKHLTTKEDGLRAPWEGRVWLNPPYGRAMQKWMLKMAEHDNGIALLFARTDTKVFHRYVFPCAEGLFFLRHRLRFLDIHGHEKADAGAASVLIAYGKKNLEAIRIGMRREDGYLLCTQNTQTALFKENQNENL